MATDTNKNGQLTRHRVFRNDNGYGVCNNYNNNINHVLLSYYRVHTIILSHAYHIIHVIYYNNIIIVHVCM